LGPFCPYSTHLPSLSRLRTCAHTATVRLSSRNFHHRRIAEQGLSAAAAVTCRCSFALLRRHRSSRHKLFLQLLATATTGIVRVWPHLLSHPVGHTSLLCFFRACHSQRAMHEQRRRRRAESAVDFPRRALSSSRQWSLLVGLTAFTVSGLSNPHSSGHHHSVKCDVTAIGALPFHAESGGLISLSTVLFVRLCYYPWPDDGYFVSTAASSALSSQHYPSRWLFLHL
jgi:hypothetical protein